MSSTYLIDAANSMLAALRYVEEDGRLHLDPRSVSIFLATGCRTLLTLTHDQKFFEDLEKGASARDNLTTEQIKTFIETFIRVDRALMVDAGMHPYMAGYLFQDA